jgi:hypothetical protein
LLLACKLNVDAANAGKVLLKLGFLYGGGYVIKREEGGKVGSGKVGSSSEDRGQQSANERIDKINQGKQRQKRHELIRQKFLEANHELKKALAIDAQHGQDVGRLFEEDDEGEDDDDNEDDDDDEYDDDDARKGHSTSVPASKLVSLLLEIARRCYQKAVAPLPPRSHSSLSTSDQDVVTQAAARKKKKAERYWKVLATLVICEAVHQHLRQTASAAPSPAVVRMASARQLSSSPSRSNVLRYSHNSGLNKPPVSRSSSGRSISLDVCRVSRVVCRVSGVVLMMFYFSPQSEVARWRSASCCGWRR